MVYSGTAFAAMAGDFLFVEVSTPSLSFTKFVPEVTSRPGDERVSRPICEPASTSGRTNKEKGEMEVSCADLRSTITIVESKRIAARYSLQVVIPCELERPHHPLDGNVTVVETYLKFGVRFPLDWFLVEILKYFGLTVFQVTPNGWAHMIGLFGLFVECKIGPLMVAEFTCFDSVKSNKNDEGFYYFTNRPLKGLKVVAKIKNSLGPWKEAYFYTLEVQVKGTFGRACK